MQRLRSSFGSVNTNRISACSSTLALSAQNRSFDRLSLISALAMTAASSTNVSDVRIELVERIVVTEPCLQRRRAALRICSLSGWHRTDRAR